MSLTKQQLIEMLDETMLIETNAISLINGRIAHMPGPYVETLVRTHARTILREVEFLKAKITSELENI